MKKIGMWAGALGIIGTMLFMLKNNYEGRKEIERLNKECRICKDAFKKANEKTCALEVEKARVKNVLRRIKCEDLSGMMIKNNIAFCDATVVYDYLSDSDD